MRKKGQTEILGLAMIVILVILGFAFALQFALREPDRSAIGVITDRQLAATTISTMLNTNIACGPFTLQEILLDCAVNNNRGYCSSNPSVFNASLRNACDEAQNLTETILGTTVGTWGRGYYFSVYKLITDPPLVFHTQGDCDPSVFTTSESAIFPLTTSHLQKIYIQMVICV